MKTKKSPLLFLDTETTGLGPEDRLFQVAFSYNEEVFDGLFKPPVPISIDSMTISHVTNEMVQDKEPFLESEMYTLLASLLPECILVAHNALFDMAILEREGLQVDRYIDTYKISHHLDSSGEIPKHSLQYLRYYHKIDAKDALAHNAVGDIAVLEKLFDFHVSLMKKEGYEEENLFEKMMEISSQPILMKRFTFGKYNGREVSQVAKEDREYLRWLLNAKIMQRERGEENDEDWIFTLDQYVK